MSSIEKSVFVKCKLCNNKTSTVVCAECAQNGSLDSTPANQAADRTTLNDGGEKEPINQEPGV